VKVDVLIQHRQKVDARDNYTLPDAERAASLAIRRDAQFRGGVTRPGVFRERSFDDFGRGHQS
jgi:hypothetical protein